MNEQELAIGPLMKAARKFKKFNQSDVAQAIGCSQSALSKMEHNLLVPSAPQWFLFARFTSIPPETIETGVIDRHSHAKLNDESVSLGYRLPKRYRLNRAEKIRTIYPYLTYLEKVNPPAYKEFTSSVGIDSEFFLDFDNLVSFQLNVDMINLFIKLGLNSPEDIRSLAMLGQDENFWDRFGLAWKEAKSTKELLEFFSRDQTFFQADFFLETKTHENKLVVIYRTHSHFYHFLKDVTVDTESFLSQYRKATLEHVVKRFIGMDVEARLVKGFSTSSLECAFEII